jgi:hypothetical protein
MPLKLTLSTTLFDDYDGGNSDGDAGADRSEDASSIEPTLPKFSTRDRAAGISIYSADLRSQN